MKKLTIVASLAFAGILSVGTVAAQTNQNEASYNHSSENFTDLDNDGICDNVDGEMNQSKFAYQNKSANKYSGEQGNNGECNNENCEMNEYSYEYDYSYNYNHSGEHSDGAGSAKIANSHQKAHNNSN